MKPTTTAFVALLFVGSITMGLALAERRDELDQRDATVAVPYHESRGNAAAPVTANLLLPVPQDPVSAEAMAAAATTMTDAAQGMAAAAATMITSGEPELVELGQHWMQDVAALRSRGEWMIVSATSDTMVHDPAQAHELNLRNLRGNGLAMADEGRALADHGRTMADEVVVLDERGAIPPATAAELAAQAQALIDVGEGLERDGEGMQETADDLLRSLGR